MMTSDSVIFAVTKTVNTGVKFYSSIGEIESITWNVQGPSIPIFTGHKNSYHGSITFKEMVNFGLGNKFNIKIVDGVDTNTIYGVSLIGEPLNGKTYKFVAVDVGPTMMTKDEDQSYKAQTLDYQEDEPDFDYFEEVDEFDMLYIPDDGISPYDFSIEISQALDPHTIDIASMIFRWIEEGLLEFKNGKIYKI